MRLAAALPARDTEGVGTSSIIMQGPRQSLGAGETHGLSRLKTLTLVIIVAAAALVPLFGDPRRTPVTHPIWARMLLRALDMNEGLRTSTHASQVFAALSWRDSLTFPADHYVRGDGVAVREDGGVRAVAATDGTGQVVYPVTVVRPGDYLMRVRLAGVPERPATAEIARMGRTAVQKTLTFLPSPSSAWVQGGPAHLDPGVYTATLLLPPGSALESVEVAPPCLDPIEPIGGWKATAPTTIEDLAVTMMKAMDLESDLPPSDTPIDRTGGDFQVEGPDLAVAPGAGLKADRKGLTALLSVDLSAPGLYTVSVHGVIGSGQRWLADACRKAVLCPSDAMGWHPVMSQSFGAGRHTFAVTLAEGAVVERVRFERKKESAAGYLAALRRLGFDPGPEGPVSWERAAAAARFIEGRGTARIAGMCGDLALPEPVVPTPVLAPPASSVAAATQGAAQAPPPSVGSVLLPPQPPASPVQPNLAAEVAGPSS